MTAEALKVLVCDKVHPSGIEMLRKAGIDVDERVGIERGDLLNIIQNYDVVMVRSRTIVDRELIFRASRLKLIARAGAGIDNIDADAAKERGISVLCAGEAVANSVAELTIGLMIALSRSICTANELVKRGEWPKGRVEGIELMGKTVGIIGVGRVGRRVAQLARAFGMNILLNDVVQIPEGFLKTVSAVPVNLDELLRNSDYVTIHVLLTPMTKHMINKENINIFKWGSFLVNTSRGEVLDEDAVYEALTSGRLRGAALDVYSTEPPKNKKLLELPNVICTPHIGAQTLEAQERVSTEIASKILRHFQRQSQSIFF